MVIIMERWIEGLISYVTGDGVGIVEVFLGGRVVVKGWCGLGLIGILEEDRQIIIVIGGGYGNSYPTRSTDIIPDLPF